MEPSASWIAHDRYVLGLAFAPGDAALYSCGMEGEIKRWRLAEGGAALDLAWQAHDKSCNALALSDDGATLISGSTDRTVKTWDAAGGALRMALTDRAQTVASVILSPSERYIAAAWYGGRVTVWDRDGALVTAVRPSPKNQVALAISPDERVLATGGLGDNLALWALPGGESLGALVGHETAVLSTRFLGDGHLLSLGYEGGVRRWDIASRECVETWRPDAQGLRGMALDPLNPRVALSAEGEVLLLSLDHGAELARIDLPVKAVGAMAFSRDGHTLAIGTADSTIRLYDLT